MKKSKEDIPVTGMAVLRQQYTLAEAIEEWIASLKKKSIRKSAWYEQKKCCYFLVWIVMRL